MKTELKVGIFFIVGLAILLIIFEFIQGFSFVTGAYTLKTYFKSISGVDTGYSVKLGGVKVGKISKIRIVDGRVEIVMEISKGTPIKEDSLASIKLTSALGVGFIDLTFGSPDSAIAPDGYVLRSKEATDLNDILAKVEAAVSSVESTFGALGDNKEKITSILQNLDVVLGGASRGEGTLGKLLKDDSLYYEAKETFASMNEISSSIKQGKGTLGKIVNDESLYHETKKTVANLGQLSEKLTDAKGTFGKLLNDETLYNQSTEAATNLNSILKKVNNGEGTLGKLVSDDSLYFDAKNTVKKVEKGVDTQEDLAPLSTLGAAFGILTIF